MIFPDPNHLKIITKNAKNIAIDNYNSILNSISKKCYEAACNKENFAKIMMLQRKEDYIMVNDEPVLIENSLGYLIFNELKKNNLNPFVCSFFEEPVIYYITANW